MGDSRDGKPWGPFISKNYVSPPMSRGDLIAAAIVFALTHLFAILAAYLGYGQTKACQRPWRCVYIWMIWLELAANIALSMECLFFLLKFLQPSFYFYISILVNWSLQVQLLLQIIINRIRVILSDRRKGKQIMVGVAVIVTSVEIAVFTIWMPARLQVSHSYIYMNEIWDRTEKVIYLLMDGTLNWYFIRVVKANLVANGLHKYDKLVRFNQRIIIVSLSMDVMIICAMSIPNGFVYTTFHPLAYLIKLNIEITMANLIKKVALDGRGNNSPVVYGSSSSDQPISENGISPRRRSFLGLALPIQKGNEIRKTEEYVVQSTPKPEAELQQRRCETYWKDRGVTTIDSMNKIIRDSVDHIGVASSTIPPSSEETTRTWSVCTDETMLVKPEPALKRW